MTLIRRTSPFGELLSLRQAMDRLFEDSFVRTRGDAPDSSALPLDVYTTPSALVIEAALPGVKPEDVEISLLGDTLTITGSSASEQQSDDDGYLYREVRRGRFSRTLTVPASLKSDAATATFENGMLTLSIPKAEAAKPRQIRITPTTEGTSVGNGVERGGEVGAPETREHAYSGVASGNGQQDNG
jgi:HSP20 family protein